MNIPQILQEFKSVIQEVTFLSRDVLHIYGGVIFFLFWKMFFKEKYPKFPLLIISIIIFFNETLDLFYYYNKSGCVKWGNSLEDVINTLFLPCVLYLFLKYKYYTDRITVS